MSEFNSGNDLLEQVLMHLKMNVPAMSSPNVEDRTGENNEIISKLARQKSRGARMQDVMGADGYDATMESGKPAAMFDDDIEETIRRGKFGEYGFLDSLMEEMARQQRKAQGLPE